MFCDRGALEVFYRDALNLRSTYLRIEHNTLQTVLKPSYFMTYFRAAAVWLESETGLEAWSMMCKVHCSRV